MEHRAPLLDLARQTSVVLVALLCTLLLAACGQSEEAADVDPPQPETEDTGPTAEPTGAGTLVGTLGGDPGLEGGCAWVRRSDGTRYEVQYPAGYEVTFDPLELVGPDGQVVAVEGDELTLTGAVDPGMMSFCQIGEIFVATAVEA